MKKLILGLFVIGLTIPSFAQKVEKLEEVIVIATNYKYLNEVNEEAADVPIKLLEKKVATYDLKGSDFYRDEYDLYYVSFHIPEGKILAAYDKDGNVLRTIEKFKGTNLPPAVYAAVTERFPGWAITKDVYLVNYHNKKGTTKKYKLRLENGDKTMRVKTDEDGKFL
ncbi:nicotinate-nucleotide adenylyltransferase [uncultured Aquimarina sp.]|uniref:nicotinate-nucleotide adenylyltransferase n=1 Tax=uncultured Aquimarina sp. TaxID=575652 RepID=UPI002606B250|nr:nicotinate-nucleotide adenylyltransferase [uncultured Aquimarina sp.]